MTKLLLTGAGLLALVVAASAQESNGPCNSVHGGFKGNTDNLHQLMIEHFEDSFKYLLLGSHFQMDTVNRKGLHGYLMRFSDQMWEQGKGLMKYILKRGGRIGDQFKVSHYESDAISEVGSLSALLDTLKNRVEDTIVVHKHAMHKATDSRTFQNSYDPGVQHYMQEHIERYEEDIRDVAGKLNILAKMTRKDNSRALGLHMFDQSLQ